MAAILGIAFILGLLGANPEAPFATWIYARSASIMKPFEGIFDPIVLSGDTAIRTSLLFAILIYAALAAIVASVSRRLTGTSRSLET